MAKTGKNNNMSEDECDAQQTGLRGQYNKANDAKTTTVSNFDLDSKKDLKLGCNK